MANSYSRKLPSIPTPRGPGITADLQKILTPMKTILENLIVERENNDLQAVDIDSIVEQVQENLDLGLIDPGTSNEEVPRPTGLVASGDVKNITLTWDAPSYSNHAYTEVYRSTTNDRPTGSRIGTTAGATFVDKTANKNNTYYYWIRFYSSGNIYGPFNADNTSGTSGTLAAITTDEFASGTAPLEFLTTNPTTGNADGRFVFEDSSDTLNVYEEAITGWRVFYTDKSVWYGTAVPTANNFDGKIAFESTAGTLNVYSGTGWVTFTAGSHVILPDVGSTSPANSTITATGYTDVTTSSLDVTNYNTAIMQVSTWFAATVATATTVDVQLVFNGVAQLTETGIDAPGTGASPFLYNRFFTVDVSTATGSLAFDFEAKKPGTTVSYTDLQFAVVAYV